MQEDVWILRRIHLLISAVSHPMHHAGFSVVVGDLFFGSPSGRNAFGLGGKEEKEFLSVYWLTSQLMASPAMAENPVSHNQRRTSVVASTPACSGALLSE